MGGKKRTSVLQIDRARLAGYKIPSKGQNATSSNLKLLGCVCGILSDPLCKAYICITIMALSRVGPLRSLGVACSRVQTTVHMWGWPPISCCTLHAFPHIIDLNELYLWCGVHRIKTRSICCRTLREVCSAQLGGRPGTRGWTRGVSRTRAIPGSWTRKCSRAKAPTSGEFPHAGNAPRTVWCSSGRPALWPGGPWRLRLARSSTRLRAWPTWG